MLGRWKNTGHKSEHNYFSSHFYAVIEYPYKHPLSGPEYLWYITGGLRGQACQPAHGTSKTYKEAVHAADEAIAEFQKTDLYLKSLEDKV